MKSGPVLLGLIAALAACSSPDPTYYTLQPVPGAVLSAALSAAPPSVEVRRPGLAGYLDRSDVVLKNAGYTLAVNSQIRWAEPLGDMIGRVLTQDLSQRLPGASVFFQLGAISADPQLRVEVDILSFDADAAGAVVLTAEVAVERGTTHAPLATRHAVLSATPDAPGAANLAAVMSKLLGSLSDQIAHDVRQSAARV